jgi:hypothetical protein
MEPIILTRYQLRCIYLAGLDHESILNVADFMDKGFSMHEAITKELDECIKTREKLEEILNTPFHPTEVDFEFEPIKAERRSLMLVCVALIVSTVVIFATVGFKYVMIT